MEKISKLSQIAQAVFTPISSIDHQIAMYLAEEDIKTRPAKSNGLWCHMLVPLVLVVYSCFDKTSLLYKITACLAVGLFIYCILFILFLSSSSMVLKETVYAGCVASGLISTLLMYVFLQQELIFSMSVSLTSTLLFSWMLRLCITRSDKTFTVGEAMIISQTVLLFTMMSMIKFFFVMHSEDTEFEFIGVIIYTILSTVGLIVTALYILKDSQRTLMTLGYVVVSAAIFVLLMLHTIFGPKCIFILVHYIFIERNRYQLFTFWLILLILAICSLCMRTKLAVKASTVTRKTFHVLASLVFLSGIIYDVYLMTLAAGIGLGVLVFVEALRKSSIEPISSALQSAFLVYSDDKDCGLFAMTPLYLYVGLSFPLLLVPDRPNNKLELLSGVLSIGIGDTAASWFGSRFGFNKWSGTDKTFEGTAFNIISQIGTVYALQLFKLLDAEHALLRTAFVAIVSGLVEARTDQIDNLVLPLVTMLAFQMTWMFL